MADLADAVVVDHLHKAYRVYASPLERVKRLVGRGGRFLDFEALHDVSFSVKSGEAVGIIGENGAGKSTLLKVVAGTTRPTAGVVSVHGVVAAILELGAAFHPEFSGRENAVLYGALLGISRAEMARRLDDVIAFAELGSFIDQPIKSYSTGMVMRLGFAVATHVDPQVLVVDEALAVGDNYFQKKCIDMIRAIKQRGTTILFCSHAMYYVTMFCDRAMWLRQGRLERIGGAKEVVEAYESYLLNREKRRLEARPSEAETAATLKVGRVVSLEARGVPSGNPADGLVPEQGLEVEVGVETVRVDEPYHVAVALDSLDGRCVLGLSTLWDGCAPLCGSRSYRVRLVVPSLPVASGTFHLSGFLLDESGLHVHDQVVLPEAIRVSPPRWTPSLLSVPHRWETT
jgi:lipopolysaccharide transport system ATP-binding protein